MLSPARQLRGLLVEDQDVDAELLIATLREAGHVFSWTRVQTEAEYRSALDAHPDIILSDYHLPRFSGLRALTILRDCGLDIPFILVSGAITEPEAAEVIRLGADDFLLKDRLGRLAAAVEGVLERRRLRDKAQQNESRLRSFLENTPAPTFIKDTGGRYLHVNPRFLQAFGMKAAAVIGNTDAAIFSAEQAAVFSGNDRRVLETGTAMTFEEQALYVDGLHTSLVTKFPLRDIDGTVHAIGGIAIDITGREAAEQRNRATFEHAPIGIIHSAIDGRVLTANPAACEILGYTRDELLEHNLRDLTHPADRAVSAQLRDRLIDETEAGTSSREKRYLRRDGTAIWVTASVALVRKPDGSADYFIAMIQDVSSRRAAEQQFRMTFEQATVGITHTTLDDRYLLANRRFCEMLGYSRGEILGMATRDIAHPDDTDKDLQQREQLLAGKISSFSGEKRYRRKDGTLLWVNRTVSLARDEDGRPQYLIRVIEDITRRKEEEELFRATFEQAAIGVALTDTSGRYLAVNDRLCGLLGYAREELLAKNALDDITHPDDREDSRAQNASLVSGRVPHSYAEKRYVRRDQGIIHVARSMSLARWPDGTPRYIISMVADLSHQKAAEDLFTASFEQAGVGMSLRLPGGRNSPWLRVNQKFCDMLGYTREELMQLTAADITLPEDQQEAHRYNEKILGGQLESYTRERRYRRKDGSTIWCNVTISSVRGSDGKPSHVIAVIQDITARKEAETHLEQTFEQAAVGIVRTDLDRRIISVNRKFCEMTGYAKEELLGTLLRRISHPDDRSRDAAARLRLLAGETDHVQTERRYLRKDGEPIWVRRTTSLVKDLASGSANYIFVIEDITARKNAEDSYQATFNMAPVGIMHTSFGREILDANPRACEILGYSREELLKMTTADILTPDYLETDRPHYLQQMLKGEMRIFRSQRPYRRKDGSTVWTDRSVSLVRDSAGEPLYLLRMMEDISERKRIEDALAQERLLLRTVIDALPERIYVRDLDGRIVLPNIAYLKIRGIERHEEIIGKTVDELFPPDMAKRYREEDRKVIESGQPMTDRETRTTRAGELGPVPRWHLTSKVPLKDGAGRVFGLVGVNRDITDRKLAEMRIMRLNRFFSTLSATNAAIVRTRDQDELFRAICRIAVSDGGLGSAWIRTHDPVTRELNVVAYAGVSRNYLSDLRVSSNPAVPEGRGLASRAFRENRVMVSNDLLSDPELARWHQRARDSGFRSLASLPFSCSDEVVGVLGLQATEQDFFDHEVVNLMQKMASDISFALTNLSLQEQHQNTLRALQESDAQFRELALHVPQVFWITDAGQRTTLYASPNYQSVTGRLLSDLEKDPKSWLAAIHEDDRQRVQFARKQKAPLGSYDIEYRVVHTDGSVRWVHDRAFPIRNVHGEVYRIAGIAEDITEAKLSREQLAQLAHFDSLTGLPNRVLFNDRLRQSVAHARRNNWTLGVLFLDLDRFKLVNDTLGHATGDLLLKQVAARLTASLRPSDTVARLSGDEFAVILSELSGPQNAGHVAQKILKALAAPIDLDGHEVFVTTSIGITLYPNDSDDIETLIRNADAAMYGAKAAGRNNYQYYTASMNARAAEKLQLETRMRRALERKEFILHYQPKIDIASGRISGLEALLRWQSPDQGLVPPAQFIPLLEETGLIVQVGEWVAQAACAQIRSWLDAGIRPVPVAINLSARQLRQPGFSEVMSKALAASGIEPRLIQIEITESSLMENPEEAIVVLEQIEALGILLAADDFGTGYSSLSYLKRFPLDALKIDRSFVHDITIDADDAVIARTVITLAHSLGLKVIAEGVETEEQLAFLGENRCDQAQGYLFSRPLTADACAALLTAGHPLHRARSADATDRTPAVLIIDDDNDHLLLSKLLLQKDGHPVLTAGNTHDAFELLANHPVSIVISDQNMPEMSGVEFLRRVKLMYPEIVRIMLSGVGDFGTATAAINEGEVHKFFVKGRDEDLLRREIRLKILHVPDKLRGPLQ
ncbi:MAG: PAS domain S-box protein [Burkholderiales bacterium]|nr:PAS domain S-box protein [Burkholderiales bacterium]